jgi:hypothetical protein
VETLLFYKNKIIEKVSHSNLFLQKPVILFKPEISVCCNSDLKVKKSHQKTVFTLGLGEWTAKENIYYCEKCGKKYRSDKLKKLVPPFCNFAYDVIVYIGKSIYLKYRNNEEIVQELRQKNINISLSQVELLAKKFIIYLSLLHNENKKLINELIQNLGGYILHLDSTCDGDSPHIMTGLDGVSKIVLHNVKINSESADNIIPFLKNIKSDFGNPLRLMHDMSPGIINAIKEIFPNIPDNICHYHFLKNIGINLFEKENDEIRKILKSFGILTKLRKELKNLKICFDENSEVENCIIKSIKNETCINKNIFEKTPAFIVYTLIQWAIIGKMKINGYGYPFHQPYLVFCQRLKIIYTLNQKLLNHSLDLNDNNPFVNLSDILSKIIGDENLNRSISSMEEKNLVFNNLRVAMNITDPKKNNGLNDEGEDVPINTIKKNVKKFYNELKNNKKYSDNKSYEAILKQIDKYWDKLFPENIVVETKYGKKIIKPNRTNNMLEKVFREIKRNHKRKSGTNSMSKKFKTMLSATPLVMNLKNEEYFKLILNGKNNLEERFAEIDAKNVRQELEKLNNCSDNISAKIKKLLKEENLPNLLFNFFSKTFLNLKSNGIL